MDVNFTSKTQAAIIKTMPTFKGSWLIYTSLLKLFPKKIRFCSLKESNINLDLSDPAQFSIVNTRHGKHELGTVNFIKQHLSKGDVFLDIGANFGYFTTIASKIVGNEGLVLAFEPNHSAYLHLIGTINRNHLFNCMPMNMALGEKEQTTMSMRKPWYRQSTSSYMVAGDSVLSDTFDHFKKSLQLTKKIKMIKIDVEGAELQVIKGLTSTLKTDKPLLIIEPDLRSQKRFGFQFNELLHYLKTVSYQPKYLLNPFQDTNNTTPYFESNDLTRSVVFEAV